MAFHACICACDRTAADRCTRMMEAVWAAVTEHGAAISVFDRLSAAIKRANVPGAYELIGSQYARIPEPVHAAHVVVAAAVSVRTLDRQALRVGRLFATFLVWPPTAVLAEYSAAVEARVP